MLDIINKGDFNPGCIYRIALENFVTYKEVELFPGKSLNLIIGPNGTGKSTFVSAIILGLCGKPSAIGQDHKISSFIKRGYKTATIEIELYNNKGMRNIIIKRIIDKRDCSEWYINHERTSEKKVQEKIKPFNIQVDNLCQLLPQHKVQDFSALKPKELLESTLKAMGRYESIQQWNSLIEKKSELSNSAKNLKRDKKNLEKLERENESLKQKIEENKKRKQLEREIEICQKKQLWLEAEDLKAKVISYTKEKTNATKLVNKRKTQLEPLKNKMEYLRKNISKLGEEKIKNMRKIQNLKDQLKQCIQSFETKQNQLINIDTIYQEKLNRHKMKENELMQANKKLDKLKTDRRALEQIVPDENNLKLELEDINQQKQTVNANIETLNRQKAEKTYALNNHMRLYENRIRILEDVQSKRLGTLHRYRVDTYKALMWLRDNRDKFQHPVYEPMMLEINFTDPKFARYLESTVPARDLIAFTFESTEDMNLFNRIVRNEQKLKLVNAVCSQGGEFNVPTRDLQHLRHLDFYTYLSDTVKAPAAIMRYLCQQYRIDQIPIGTDHTYRNSDRVPGDLKFFFTENHRFSIRVSAYGSKSSTTIEINDASLLANSVDEQQITHLKNKYRQYQNEKNIIDNDITRKLADLENRLQELDHRGKEKNISLEQIKGIKFQIHMQTKKIQALLNEPTIDIEQEKARCEEQYKEFVSKQCKVHSEIYYIMNEIRNKELIKMRICMIQIDLGRDEELKSDSIYRKFEDELQAATAKLVDIENNLKKAASKANQKLNEVMQACDRKLPTDASFPYAEEFNDLPSDLALLHEYKSERITKINFMEDIDSQTLKDYDIRNKEIERLTHILNTSSKSSTKQQKDMDILKSKWLLPLESLIEEISAKFTEMFEKPGCTGEIALYRGNGEDDFAGYGVNMMVKFRPNEPLSALTRHSQSGGERAFATAIYLLALQARTVAPFRCVDEINQGLDIINERKMLQLLIRETAKSNSQYFLLSPTLLLDLEYSEKVMVHTIMTGNHIVNYKQWNTNEFLRIARNRRQNN